MLSRRCSWFWACAVCWRVRSFYERSQFRIRRARRLRARLDELLPDAQVQPLQSIAEEEHNAHYPVLSQVRLNTIWLGVHLLVVILGVVDTIICFGR
ncbi:MAG: hypothetical protein JO202_05425 [Ktedonobacteraceae bacterium]|nr:hypothetical protein [Ktedonobacteraceae bacterium]